MVLVVTRGNDCQALWDCAALATRIHSRDNAAETLSEVTFRDLVHTETSWCRRTVVGTRRRTAMKAVQTPQLRSLTVHPPLLRQHRRTSIGRQSQRQVQLHRRGMAPAAVIQQQPQSALASDQPDVPRRVAIFVVGPAVHFGRPSRCLKGIRGTTQCLIILRQRSALLSSYPPFRVF